MKHSIKCCWAILIALAGLTLASPAATPTVTQIAAGTFHSLYIRSDGSLWGMGLGQLGELGANVGIYTNKPAEIVSANVVAMAAGLEETLYIKSPSSLWGLGGETYGSLGVGNSFSYTNIPVEIEPSNVLAVASGDHHTLFRSFTSTGSPGHQTITLYLMGMGYNNDGQLGLGTTSNQFTPAVIQSSIFSFFPNLGAMAGSSFDSYFIGFDGSLDGMGDNYYGELGNGTSNNSSYAETLVPATSLYVTAVAAAGYHCLYVKSDGSLWSIGYAAGILEPQQILPANVSAVAVGNSESLFIETNGSLWGFGDNSKGQLGQGTNTTYNLPVEIQSSNVTAVACGYSHTLFTKSDGSLWAMGDNDLGELGDGFTNSSLFPEQIYPTPAPTLTKAAVSAKTNLQVSATCLLGGQYRLLMGTNINQPLTKWTPVATNSVTARGSNNFVATLTNAIIPGSGNRFFVLQPQ